MLCTAKQLRLSDLSFLFHLTDPKQELLRLVAPGMQESHMSPKLYSNDKHPALEAVSLKSKTPAVNQVFVTFHIFHLIMASESGPG